jgi:hypothetical protein
MSKSRRREPTTPVERELPLRPRLDPPPDFIPHVIRVDRPTWEVSMGRTPCLNGPTLYAYVQVERHIHLYCEHDDLGADRFGNARCECGAHLWSPWWVADGLYGLAVTQGQSDVDGTSAYIAEREADFGSTVEPGGRS